MAQEWQPIDSAPQDGLMLQLYYPGHCMLTGGVLQGYWDATHGVWILNPYGTVVFTSLFPTHWCDLTRPPSGHEVAAAAKTPPVAAPPVPEVEPALEAEEEPELDPDTDEEKARKHGKRRGKPGRPKKRHKA
jgi:hypothetical protein